MLQQLTRRQLHTINLSQREVFRLDPSFIAQYQNQRIRFGFNGVGELAYKRSYARVREDLGGRQEQWHETVERVINGIFTMSLRHHNTLGLKWDQGENDKIAREMYQRIYTFKFLPPGRGLWAMGTAITEDKHLYAALNNCAFVSTKPSIQTENVIEKFIQAFTFLMDSAMIGIGVGFDTKGSDLKLKVHKPLTSVQVTKIPDTREGWVDSLALLLHSYLKPSQAKVTFDYTQIRPAGIPLKTFGGQSSGPGPLIKMHELIVEMFERKLSGSELVRARDIVDIMNIIGKCVIAGNIRRVAEIALGEPYDKEFIRLKDYDRYPDRVDYGWVSNNSIYAELGMDYSDIQESILKNGEPGLCWLENMKAFGRMADPANYLDHKAAGGNPCLEQTLESMEMCCLVETFPNNHSTYQDYQETLKLAFTYAKLVTLGLPHWEDSVEVMARNRRIGCSMSGIAQFIADKGIHNLVDWCNKGYDFLNKYDAHLSKSLHIPESIKKTSIKPSGTVSLLAGATPGVHFPHSRHYIRRVRLGKNSNLVESMIKTGYKVEQDVMDSGTLVVEIPVSLGDKVRTLSEVTMWEQLQMASLMQKYWADNQVSCTVTFDPEKGEDKEIKNALNYFQYSLKGISFLPRTKTGAYPQMPYEEITKEEYQQRFSKLKDIELNPDHPVLRVKDAQIEDPTPENYCDGDTCKL
ncbi:hypothetical protein FGO68_gene2829 [Halteria grandinella]|uniref:ribonucleoside-triphosphate reductase (thioredoxin) n=1 Tax=Halteria grandinella TaxID=5974 RepID=A0A8J8NUD0_HALGN|nr:hypothetical protein FGO68_gene2829 [Halteria grandinella]